MKHEQGKFHGARNMEIFQQSWLPEGEVKAVLLIVHGIGEHSGRYMNLVNHFVPLGYAVYGLDHPGHGNSEGTRVFVERFSDFTDTLKIYFDQIRAAQPGKPIFLVAHSMGGLIGCVYLLDHQDELSGAIVSAPAIKIADSISATTIMAGRFFSVVAPKLGIMALDASTICSDPAVVAAYLADPLVYNGKVTARLAAEMLAGMQRVTDDVGKIHLPLLIMQGGADRLVDPGGATMLYEQSSSSDKTLKVYDGFYHEVMNEPGRAQVLGDMQTWLEKHIGK
ncbi:MAG: alpha/beta hydrolase [Anaerolineales bacterium]|jgi:alpha-beta hydrolase superfamily lysophospholipase|nr:alpha/beta hydrolase [Anaerolineales bacterium]